MKAIGHFTIPISLSERSDAGEQRGLAYLFKLRQTQRVGQMIAKLARQGNKAGWRNAGQGWEGVEQELQLQGWTLARRVIVLRRKLEAPPKTEPDPAQPSLPGLMLVHKGGEWYEHAVLVTNWAERELLAVAQMYRDRAGAENLFDDLLGRISHWLKLFVKPAEQLKDERRWGLTLRRIFEDFGRFAFQGDPKKQGLVAVKCRI